MPFYKKYFGIGYPLPKADLIAIADFAAGKLTLVSSMYSIHSIVLVRVIEQGNEALFNFTETLSVYLENDRYKKRSGKVLLLLYSRLRKAVIFILNFILVLIIVHSQPIQFILVSLASLDSFILSTYLM